MLHILFSFSGKIYIFQLKLFLKAVQFHFNIGKMSQYSNVTSMLLVNKFHIKNIKLDLCKRKTFPTISLLWNAMVVLAVQESMKQRNFQST